MDDNGSVEPRNSATKVNPESFALRRIKRFGIAALGLGSIAFAIAVFFIIQYAPHHRLVLVLLTAIYLLIIFLVLSAIHDISKMQRQVVDERQNLDARIETDRRNRQNREWIDSAVNSIVTQMKESIDLDEIIDIMLGGIGRKLRSDFVHLYSLAEFQSSRFLRQWSRTTITPIDVSKIANYESRLTDLTKRLKMTSDVSVVTDSQLIDELPHSYLDLIPIRQEVARSWILITLGEVNRGLGYVWIGMAEDARVWSDAELGFVKRIVSETSQVLAHAWMFNQSMQIAANDAEVGRLVELGKVKNSFIENMNHELRTPLTSIIGYLEVILEDVDAHAEPDLASSLTAVQRNALRLQILIENMMQISKTDFEHVSLVVSTVDVGHLLGDVVNSLQLGAEDSGVAIKLRLDSPSNDLIIEGDLSQLEQVFVNLLSNAIKFTPRNGSVTVAARRFRDDGDNVEVKVIDTGIGIPENEFPNVFQRFFRATTAIQASIPGFGIGLSLVHSIVSEHDGTVTFDSTVGKGTVFTVKLPTRRRASRRVKVAV
ncbi:MAG: HAMP domain-containing sensor histidine kinase [Ilumatobacteraceae bacterium]